MLRCCCYWWGSILPRRKGFFKYYQIKLNIYIIQISEKDELYSNSLKIFIVAALDATFDRKDFWNVLGLVPVAERLTKLSAVCADCQFEASFTSRTTESKEIELIGGEDIYKPTCRACFFRERKLM